MEWKRKSIYVCRYVLKSGTALNAVSARREFEGALIRVGDGFGCLHPWPELGDPGLEDLLGELVEDRIASPLAEQALVMAMLDEYYRAIGRAVMHGEAAPVPESHATLAVLQDEAVERAVARGFRVMKVKGGRDFPALAVRLDDLSRRFPDVRWRVDFNEVLGKNEVLAFVQCTTDHVRRRIEFLEDPCPYHETDWGEIAEVTRLPLALDYHLDDCARAAEVVVIKPARDPCGLARLEPKELEFRNHRFVVTSNMDHPLGQCYAAWQSARLASITDRVDCCGLQTHELFEPNEFSECLGPAGPGFRFAEGTGLGFDALLEKLPWKRLS